MFSYVLLGAGAVLALGYGTALFCRWLAAHWFLGVIWRFLSGKRRDNRPGRHKRALRNTGIVVAAVALVAGFAADPRATEWMALRCLLAAVALTARWPYERVRYFWFRYKWLRPAHLRTHRLAEIDYRRAPHAWLEAAPDRSWARAQLPAGWSGDDAARRALVSTLSAAFGMESPEPSWHLAGPKPVLTLVVAKPPPPAVSLAQVLPFIEAAGPDEVVCGLGRQAVRVSVDLDGDSAHLGLTMGSGGGKSVTSRLILAQQLRKGDIGLVLDVKRLSHAWARDLPNVAYCREPEDVHDALLWLAGECDRRNKVADVAADIEGHVHANVGPRIIVIAEELNSLMKRLRAYWLRERGPGDPARSPALDALDEVLCMGRQVRINVVMIGQRLSDRATGGGGDARENLAALIFARYKPSTWKMLVPDLPMPPRTKHKLRVEVVTDEVRSAQVPLLTGRQARDLALAGVVTPLPPGMPGAPRVTGYRREAIDGSDLGGVTQQPGIPLPPVTGLVTIRQAIAEGILPEGTTPEAVKQAAYRDRRRPEIERVFPVAQGKRGLAKLYDAADLADWVGVRR